MGLFGKKKSNEERTADAMRTAENMVAGKGLTGRLGKSFMGAENAALLGQGLDSARNAQEAAALAAAGIPGVPATVTNISDTGQLINFDPVVVLTATLADGQVVTLQTLVSKIQVPRTGDTVSLIQNPAQPGTYVYGGLTLPPSV